MELKAACEESAFWCGGARELLYWRFDCSAAAAALSEDGGEAEPCTVSPTSGSLGPGRSVRLEVRVRPAAVTTGEKRGQTRTHIAVSSLSSHRVFFFFFYVVLPSGPGRVIELSLPLYLGAEGMTGEKGQQPYRELRITIACQPPRITIHPPRILLTPVPLESTATATLALLASGYPRWVTHTHTHTLTHTHCCSLHVFLTFLSSG